MQNKFFKKNKINQLQNIKQNYKYIYLFRYNDLTINEMILIKKKIKNLNYKSSILKQNIINNFFINLKGQGPLLIIYGNEYLDLINNMINFKKIEPIFLILDENIYSFLKLKEMMINSNSYLNITLIRSFLNFIHYLRKI
jgi:ribosomal protein L10